MKTRQQLSAILDAYAKRNNLTDDQSLEIDQHDIPVLLELLEEKYGKEKIAEYINILNEERSKIIDMDNMGIGAENDDDLKDLVDRMTERMFDYYKAIKVVPGDIKAVAFAVRDLDEQALIEETKDHTSGNLPEDMLNKLEILSIVNRRPKKYVMTVDNISNKLTELVENNQIYVGKKGAQPVRTAVAIDCPPHMKLDGNINFTAYDKSIVNAVSSIIEAGNTSFSIPTLYHAMTGKENPTVDEGLLEDLKIKIEKLRRMMLTIDLTNEIKANFMDQYDMDIEDFIIDGYLLPLTKMSAKVNGKITEVYQILDTPPIYKYAKIKQQIATVPINLLNAPLNNNATTIPLKNYLLYRIEGMKNPKNNIHSNKILYESIYEELNEKEANKIRKKRIRDYTKIILQHCIQEGYIKSFQELKKGKSIDSIVIEF